MPAEQDVPSASSFISRRKIPVLKYLKSFLCIPEPLKKNHSILRIVCNAYNRKNTKGNVMKRVENEGNDFGA